MLDTLRRWIAATISTTPSTVERQPIDEDTIRESFKTNIPNYDDGVHRTRLDSEFWAPKPADVDAVLDTQVQWLPYESSEFDCEDFALLTKNVIAMQHGINSVGVVVDYEGAHSYNVIVDADGNTHVYEPQGLSKTTVTGNPFPPSELPVGDNYKMKRGRILI